MPERSTNARRTANAHGIEPMRHCTRKRVRQAFSLSDLPRSRERGVREEKSRRHGPGERRTETGLAATLP